MPEEKVICGYKAFSDLQRTDLQQKTVYNVSSFYRVIDIVTWGTNKALSFWAVTILDPVWVIKNQILDCFLNPVLARPQVTSVGDRQNCRRPPTFPHSHFNPSFRTQRPKWLFFTESSDSCSMNWLGGSTGWVTDSHPLHKSNLVHWTLQICQGQVWNGPSTHPYILQGYHDTRSYSCIGLSKTTRSASAANLGRAKHQAGTGTYYQNQCHFTDEETRPHESLSRKR
jgi:hypothetical protein